MGGHGGLNILPQKRWNVYGREQRLKVARDEAKYEAEQAEVREKAAAADRERRRQQLLQLARERYGGEEAPPALEGAAAVALEYPGAEPEQRQAWQQPPAAESWETDAAAMRGLAAGQADHMAALEQQQRQQQQQQPRKRQRRREQAAAACGPPPSLAQLAAGLDRPTPEQRAIFTAGGAGGTGQGELAAGSAQQGGGKLERFNLFAEEEALTARRKPNPEAEAEKREERRRRGDPDTQTSDACFDQQFMFAHKLHGAQAMPWYAKRGSTLPTDEDGQQQQQQQQGGGGRKQMWQWEMEARAALAGVGRLHEQQEAQAPQQGQEVAARVLLAGVKVTPAGGRAEDKRSRRRRRSGEGSSSTSSSSSSDSSSSSSSDSDSSSGRRRRRRNGNKGGGSKRWRKEKERKRGRKQRGGGGGGKKSVEELRLERLQREEAERLRQQRLLAVAAGRDPGLVGRKFYNAFGFGRK